MKVLVTGGTGFVGSHLVDRLLAENHAVRCLVRRSSKRTWLSGKPLEYLECDTIADPGVIRSAVRDVDVIFHVLGTLVAPNLEAFREVNVRPVRLLLDACEARGGLQRFVLVGSQGAAGPTLDPDGRTTEADFCRPVSAYGRSKLEAEEVTREYAGKVPYTIVRLSAVYGPRDTSLLKMFRWGFRRGVVPQIGSGSKVNSLTHVRDCVEGTRLAAISEKSLNEVYFVASEEACSTEDIRAAFSAAMGRKIKVRVIPDLMVQAMMLYADFQSKVFGRDILLNRDRLTTLAHPRWVCDVSKARADLGYRQTVAFDSGVRETYEWYRREGWL